MDTSLPDLVEQTVIAHDALSPDPPLTASLTLTGEQLVLAKALLEEIRQRLDALSGGDRELLFAYRRKITKELVYDERSKPATRKKLKKQKFRQQKGKCAVCQEPLPETYAVLDRFSAVDGYTDANTRLIHQHCDIHTQRERGYASFKY